MFRFLNLFPEFAPEGSDGGTDGDGNDKPGESEDKPGSDTDKGDDDKKSPDNKDDKPTLEDFQELKKKYDDLTVKAGKQGNELGKKAKDFEALTKKMSQNPKDFIKALADNKGIDLSFDKKADNPHKDLMSDDEDVRQAAMNKMSEEQKALAIRDSILAEISPAVQAIQNDTMANKYPDFDTLTDDRMAIEGKVNAGVITRTELFHKAAQADNLKESLEAAKKEAVEEYVEDLRKKAEADADTSGLSDPKKGVDKTQDMTGFVNAMLKT